MKLYIWNKSISQVFLDIIVHASFFNSFILILRSGIASHTSHEGKSYFEYKP